MGDPARHYDVVESEKGEEGLMSSYTDIEVLRAAQYRVREAGALVRGITNPESAVGMQALEDAIEYLAAATKRIEDFILALSPPKKGPQ